MIHLNIHLAESVKIKKIDYPQPQQDKAFVCYVITIAHADGHPSEVCVFGRPDLTLEVAA
jgi:hypothetical protein